MKRIERLLEYKYLLFFFETMEGGITRVVAASCRFVDLFALSKGMRCEGKQAELYGGDRVMILYKYMP
jgi:hypothetical protein